MNLLSQYVINNYKPHIVNDINDITEGSFAIRQTAYLLTSVNEVVES